MHARERIIRERFADQTCGHCGATYPPDGILVLARRPAAWMIMASCHACENRSIFVVSFHDAHDPQNPHDGLTIGPSFAHHLFPEAVIPSEPSEPSEAEPPSDLPSSFSPRSTERRPANPEPVLVTASDVADMREFLSSFSGDFQSLFQRQRQRHKDDSSAD